MSKDDAVRITDTIAFIRTATVPPMHNAKRALVADMLRDRDAAGLIPNTASAAMSQGSNSALRGRDAVLETRQYRRAIILIRMALENADRSVAPPATAIIPDANLSAALGLHLDAVTTTIADLTTKLAQLQAHPLQFLAANAFNMVGASTSGVMPYGFIFDPLENKYHLAPIASVGNLPCVEIDVFQLHVQPYASLATTDRPVPPGGQSLHVAGTVVHGADLMVTTQLTGCAIVYHHHAGSLVAAHVQPTGIVAETACTNLRAGDTTLSLAPGNAATAVFGPQNPKGVNVNNYQKQGAYNYCVGVRIGGTWGLYAQQRAPGNGGNKLSWQIS
ncbi:hypothetical protein [Gemmatimonas sp.]|uniref:hypothetical protein n=1 Tax=Gemmatimonas sp. TaxID=1962908 RepID=UPI003982E60B